MALMYKVSVPVLVNITFSSCISACLKLPQSIYCLSAVRVVIRFGLIQVFGSALIAGGVGLAAYGGYLGMFDWATVWPLFTVIMKFLGYFGVAIVVLILLAIPQLQYRKHPDTYFLITEDYDEYLEKMKEKEAQKA